MAENGPVRILILGGGFAGMYAALEFEKILGDRLRVPGFDRLWAMGDCAAVPDPVTGKPHPPTAQHALRQGKVLARNVHASIRGREPAAFSFSTIGQLAAIGRRTGVARIFGMQFSGFFAWWLWRTIYLSKLPRLEKKIRVLLDWTLDLFFTKDLVQFRGPDAAPLRGSTAAPRASVELPRTVGA